MEIIQPRRTVHVTQYFRRFNLKNEPGAGFLFECYENGLPIIEGLPQAALENLQMCLWGKYDVVPREGVFIDGSYDYQEAAQGRCSCGRLVDLVDPMTNTCECGQEYNGFGQELAPRSQWEEPWDED